MFPLMKPLVLWFHVNKLVFALDKRAIQTRSPEEEAGTRGGTDEENGGGEEKETRRTQKVGTRLFKKINLTPDFLPSHF